MKTLTPDLSKFRGDPDNPPDWIYSDSPDLCTTCLDAGVYVEGLTRAAYYAENGERLPSYQDTDKMVTVARVCECAAIKERERRVRLQVDGLPRALACATLNGISQTYAYRKKGGEAARKLVDSIKANNPGPHVLILFGPTGTGKTYCAIAALHEVIYENHTAKFITSAELCNDFQRYALDVNENDKYLQSLLKYDLLVIDDLGSERLGPEGSTIRDCYPRLLKTFEAKGHLILTSNFANIDKGFTEKFGDEGHRIARRLGDVITVGNGACIYYG